HRPAAVLPRGLEPRTHGQYRHGGRHGVSARTIAGSEAIILCLWPERRAAGVGNKNQLLGPVGFPAGCARHGLCPLPHRGLCFEPTRQRPTPHGTSSHRPGHVSNHGSAETSCIAKRRRAEPPASGEETTMIGVLLAMAGAGMLLSILAARRASKLWQTGILVGAMAGLSAAVLALQSREAWELRSSARVGGEAIHLRLDAVSALFLALLSVLGGAGAVYALEYWSDAAHPRSVRAGRMWWSTLLLCLGLVLVAANGLHFLIAWELFTLAAYCLVTLDRRSREACAAGWLYLGASH